MRVLAIVTLAATLIAPLAVPLPAWANDDPAPPSAPTPDEAAAAKPEAAPQQAAAPAATPATGEQASSKPSSDKQAASGADADKEAVRKAQENGSYKMKDGGMYQPPQARPAPLWNKEYGRT